jgi:hypothetical protein
MPTGSKFLGSPPTDLWEPSPRVERVRAACWMPSGMHHRPPSLWGTHLGHGFRRASRIETHTIRVTMCPRSAAFSCQASAAGSTASRGSSYRPWR